MAELNSSSFVLFGVPQGLALGLLHSETGLGELLPPQTCLCLPQHPEKSRPGKAEC